MVSRNAHKIQRKGWDEEKQEKRKEEVEENDNDNDEESCLAYNNGFYFWKVAFLFWSSDYEKVASLEKGPCAGIF